MISRAPASSWQTILADLTLILFMVTASALANAPDAPLGPDTPALPKSAAKPLPPPPPKPVEASLRAEPVSVWTDGPGAPPLAEWLATEARDPRLRLTIAVRFARDRRIAALERAARLAREAGAHALSARIVVEAGTLDGASVTLGYDAEGGSGTGFASLGA
jgi:hypothetical protein